MPPKKKLPSVYALTSPARCFNCDARLDKGSYICRVKVEDEKEVRCVKCAGIDDLVFLPAGNGKLTKQLSSEDGRVYAVLRWSELWKTYERQGLLVEKEKLDAAKQGISN